MKEATAVYAEVAQAIQEQADSVKVAVKVYIEHVFTGGDPAEMERDKNYHSPAGPWSQHIVNAYRETIGQVPNPYAPKSLQFRLFDRLLSPEGCSAQFGNHRVESLIKASTLAKEGWKLDRYKEAGKVRYRLVKITVGSC